MHRCNCRQCTGVIVVRHAGLGRAFATRLDATGSSLVWSSTFGGSKINRPRSIALGLDGSVVVAGFTQSADFPTTPGALRETYPGNREDGFVVRLDASGSFPIYSTFLDVPERFRKEPWGPERG